MPVMSLRSQHNKLQQRAAGGERELSVRAAAFEHLASLMARGVWSGTASGARCTLIGTKLCVKPTQAVPTTKAETKRDPRCTLSLSLYLFPSCLLLMLMLLLLLLMTRSCCFICSQSAYEIEYSCPKIEWLSNGGRTTAIGPPKEKIELYSILCNNGKLRCGARKNMQHSHIQNFCRLSKLRCSFAWTRNKSE